MIRRLVVALRTDFDATTERWFAKSLEYGTVALGIFIGGLTLIAFVAEVARRLA